MDVHILAKRIRERLQAVKACTVFESDLEPLWPRDQLPREKREREIQVFARKNGWTATVLDPGIRVTFRKSAVA